MFKRLCLVFWNAFKVATFVIAFIVFWNLAALEVSYFTKYDNAHTMTIREHERQKMVTVNQLAQRSIQLQAEALSVSLKREMERNVKLEKAYAKQALQMTIFIKKLKQVDPEAFRRTVEALEYIPPEE